MKQRENYRRAPACTGWLPTGLLLAPEAVATVAPIGDEGLGGEDMLDEKRSAPVPSCPTTTTMKTLYTS